MGSIAWLKDRTMKRIPFLLICLIIVISMTACSGSVASSTSVVTTATTVAATTAQTTTKAPTTTVATTIATTEEPTTIETILSIDEKKKLSQTYDYATLVKSSADYENKWIKVTGKVVDFIDGEDQFEILLTEEGSKDKLWYIYYMKKNWPEMKIGITITAYGELQGFFPWDYTSGYPGKYPNLRSYLIEIK